MSLTASVGSYENGAVNRESDVREVQTLLTSVAASQANPEFDPLGIDGLIARQSSRSNTVRAIIAFQRQVVGMQYPDARIDPDGRTWKTLVATAGGAVTPPETPRLFPESIMDVKWETWANGAQLLLNPGNINHNWNLDFGGNLQRPIMTFAMTCAPQLKTPHVGVAMPIDCTLPAAYLLYLHHSTDQDYREPDYFLKGIGDVLVGRQSVVTQLSQSGKDIVVLVPEPRGQSLGIFNTDPNLLLACLKELDQGLTQTTRELPPILLASYSDGIGQVQKFEQNCSALLPRVKAVYDLDGAFVTRFRHYNFGGFVSSGARVFRYVGNPPPKLNTNESGQAYLQRLAGQSPSIIALPKSRWVNHFNSKWNHSGGEGWWLHYFIPTCMLSHGLMATNL